MLEVELKSVVTEWDATLRRVEAAGASLVFSGRLEDRRFDTADHALLGRDEVLRLRVYRDAIGERAEVHWKGPTSYESGYKRRQEIGSPVPDAAALTAILERLGYTITFAVDREVRQYEVCGATVRFERYPRMDSLVEVEGSPEQIERAIATTGLAREGFTSARLPEFVRRYEQRTGGTAALSDAERTGARRYDRTNA